MSGDSNLVTSFVRAVMQNSALQEHPTTAFSMLDLLANMGLGRLSRYVKIYSQTVLTNNNDEFPVRLVVSGGPDDRKREGVTLIIDIRGRQLMLDINPDERDDLYRITNARYNNGHSKRPVQFCGKNSLGEFLGVFETLTKLICNNLTEDGIAIRRNADLTPAWQLLCEHFGQPRERARTRFTSPYNYGN